MVILAILLDRWLKFFAVQNYEGQWWIARFVLVKNNALVFSWPLSNTVGAALMLLALAAVIMVWWRGWKRRDDRQVYGATLMILGALSNLIDRLAYGFVVDWASLGRWWPVFNLADVMITVGLALLLWPRPTSAPASGALDNN